MRPGLWDWLGLARAEQDSTRVSGRYQLLRRNLTVLMLLVTLAPLTVMAAVNFLQYRTALSGEIIQPLRALVSKGRHSIDLILAERLSAVNFIASAYSFEQLADEDQLRQIFRVAKNELSGFVDLGLIDSSGLQVSYVGPYNLQGKQYQEQSWFRKVQLGGSYISDVFLGYREFPHMVMAVERTTDDGRWWIVRATLDTRIFDDLIASIDLGPSSDTFLVNRKGVLQTESRFFGQVLEFCPICVLPTSWETTVLEQVEVGGQDALLAYTNLAGSDLVLVAVKPRSEVLKTWYALKKELFFLFLGSVLVITLVIVRLTGIVVQRIQDADQKQQLAFREVEHSHKLSSIGRLAAGVAHEINNPMAIINQKAGLMRDLVEGREDLLANREKLLSLISSVLAAVDRCRTITHRLLGFARRMEVEIEELDLNDVVREVLGFLEKEATFRNITLQLELAEDLPRISSDRGQLQQVFLNILTNAFAAVEDGGRIGISSFQSDAERLAVAIHDNGCGMTTETRQRIFEPFFTTKRDYGTGLGLSITYGIVTKLGGDVTVDSRLGEGTTITVLLPRQSRVE